MIWGVSFRWTIHEVFAPSVPPSVFRFRGLKCRNLSLRQIFIIYCVFVPSGPVSRICRFSNLGMRSLQRGTQWVNFF